MSWNERGSVGSAQLADEVAMPGNIEGQQKNAATQADAAEKTRLANKLGYRVSDQIGGAGPGKLDDWVL